MPSLSENLTSRVRKLLKPTNAQQALQPVLEAMSNAVMAIADRYDEASAGKVSLTIKDLGSDNVSIVLKDDGVGLDEDHYEAFLVVDTDFKADQGGKGVGRLYWLDAFALIEVESQFKSSAGEMKQRAFKFVLQDEDQVQEIAASELWEPEQTGTVVRFRGLRAGAYASKFPRQAAMVTNHTASEFIAGFLSRNTPRVDIQITTSNGVLTEASFPDDVADLVEEGPLEVPEIDIPEFGSFFVQAFLCDKRASRGMKLKHGLHLLGNDRTVETRRIDDLIGLGDLSTETADELRMHLIVSSAFLDDRTAESRTAFTVPEADLAEITRQIVDYVRGNTFAAQFSDWDKRRRAAFAEFLEDQPIYAFANPDKLFEDMPANATSPEQFVRSLSVQRMRREQDRERRIGQLVGSLVSGDMVPEEFPELVREAADGIQANEQTALAHHAARRKVVLDLLDQLIRRVRDTDDGSSDKHHLERTLHSLLVPMQVAGSDPNSLDRSAHDLWILDERLTYTAGFSSDLQLRKTVPGSKSSDRPDIMLWDLGFGLGPIEEPYGDNDVDEHEPLKRVFIVELKKPGRKDYGPSDRLEDQLTKYVRELTEGEIESFGRRRIKVSSDCQFYCLVIADVIGQLKDGELYSWDPIDNGAGRRRVLNRINTVIDVIDWSEALRSARERNRALLTMAGLHSRAKTAFARSRDAAE